MNNLEMFLFYTFSAIAIVTSILVVTSKRPTYAVLALAVGIIGLSGLFTLLHAYFVAIIQILIYAGAILVLFLFVIMLLGIDGDGTSKKTSNVWRSFNALLAFAFLAELFVIISVLPKTSATQKMLIGTAEAIGRALFNQYLLPFELISFILLIGVLGVVGLTRKEPEKPS